MAQHNISACGWKNGERIVLGTVKITAVPHIFIIDGRNDAADVIGEALDNKLIEIAAASQLLWCLTDGSLSQHRQ